MAKKLCFLTLPEFTAKTVFMNNSGQMYADE